MSNPFADALRPLKDQMAKEVRTHESQVVAKYKQARVEREARPKHAHHPDNHTLYAFNNNEQPNLNQLVTDCPPEGGWAAYLADMDRS